MDKFLFSISDDSDVSSASILQIEVIHFGKLYKYIRNNRGSKTEPIEIPVNMLFHRDVCQFKITSKFFIARKMLSLFIVKKIIGFLFHILTLITCLKFLQGFTD